MRDIGRQFNKMKSECLKEDSRLLKVVQEIYSVEKRAQPFVQNVKENTPIIEDILLLLQTHLHNLRLEKINKKIQTFKMKDYKTQNLNKTI